MPVKCIQIVFLWQRRAQSMETDADGCQRLESTYRLNSHGEAACLIVWYAFHSVRGRRVICRTGNIGIRRSVLRCRLWRWGEEI